jgi:iron-sulfur cluster assembly protein
MDTIHVTENALKNIRALQENMDAQGYGLRFGYTDGGCSGNKYIIEFEDAPEADDMVFTFDEVQVFVNRSQMTKLKNSVIDWKESLMEAGFDIDNPQAKRACGCGESIDLG